MASSKTRFLEEKIENLLANEDTELVLVELKKQGKSWLLQVFIDHPDGVNLDLCESVSRRISDFLDEEDPIESQFTLEVSSPGIERPLVRPQHFEKYVGERIEVKTFQAVSGKKKWTGSLLEFTENRITVEDETDQQTYTIELEAISRAKLKPILDFN